MTLPPIAATIIALDAGGVLSRTRREDLWQIEWMPRRGCYCIEPMELSWLWLLPVAAGATMQVVSVFWFERLRPDVPYPLWTFATREPGRVRALRVGGGATLIAFAAVMLVLSRGAPWFLTPIVVAAAFVPMIVAIYVVNGRFTRREARVPEAID